MNQKVKIVQKTEYPKLEDAVNELISIFSVRDKKLVSSTFTTTFDQRMDEMVYTAYLVFA